MTITRYTTQNSVYDVDTELNRYRRLPYGDEWFKAPELRNSQGSDKLVDGPWLPLCPERQVHLIFHRTSGDTVLNIFAPTSNLGIYTSPVVSVESLDLEEAFA